MKFIHLSVFFCLCALHVGLSLRTTHENTPTTYDKSCNAIYTSDSYYFTHNGYTCVDYTTENTIRYTEAPGVYFYQVATPAYTYTDHVKYQERNYGYIVLYVLLVFFIFLTRRPSCTILIYIIHFGYRVAWLAHPDDKYYNQVLSQIDSFTYIVEGLELLYRAQFIVGIKTIIDTFKEGARDSLVLFLIICNFIIAFGFSLTISHGSTLLGYNDFGFSTQHVMTILFGEFEQMYIISDQYVIGYVMWIVIVLIIVFVLQNIFIAIYINAYAKISERTKHKKMIKYTACSAILTYVKMYLNYLDRGNGSIVFTDEIDAHIAETVGLKTVKECIDTNYNTNVQLNDMFDFYGMWTRSPPAYKNFQMIKKDVIKKFITIQRKDVIGCLSAPFYILMFIVTIIYGYSYINTNVEIPHSNDIKSLPSSAGPFDDQVYAPASYSGCQNVNDIYYEVIDGNIHMYYPPKSYAPEIIMYITLVVYAVFAVYTKSLYALLVTLITSCLVIMRIIIRVKDNCDTLGLVQISKNLTAFLIFVESFGIIFIFSTNRRIKVIFKTVENSYKEIINIILVACVIMFMFACAGYMVFKYTNLADSFFSFFAIFSNGTTNFKSDARKGEAFAAFYYSLFAFVGTYVLYNMIVAVITSEFTKASKKIFDNHLVKKKFDVLFGIPYEFTYIRTKRLWDAIESIKVSQSEPIKVTASLPEREYNEYIRSVFGEDTEELYSEIVGPIAVAVSFFEFMQERIEKEIWMRLLETTYVVSKSSKYNPKTSPISPDDV